MTCRWMNKINTIEDCGEESLPMVSIFYDEILIPWSDVIIRARDSSLTLGNPNWIDVYSIGSLNSTYEALGIKVSRSGETYEGASEDDAWSEDSVTLIEIVDTIYHYRFSHRYGPAYSKMIFESIEANSFDTAYLPYGYDGHYQGDTIEYTIVDIKIPSTEAYSGTPLPPMTLVLRAVGN